MKLLGLSRSGPGGSVLGMPAPALIPKRPALLCGAARLFQHFGGQLGDDNGLGMFLQGRLFVSVLTVLCVGQGAFPPSA